MKDQFGFSFGGEIWCHMAKSNPFHSKVKSVFIDTEMNLRLIINNRWGFSLSDSKREKQIPFFFMTTVMTVKGDITFPNIKLQVRVTRSILLTGRNIGFQLLCSMELFLL